MGLLAALSGSWWSVQARISEDPQELWIHFRVRDVQHEVGAVEGAGLYAAPEIGRDRHGRRAGAGHASPAAATHPKSADQDRPPAVGMIGVRCEDASIRHLRLQIYVKYMAVIGPCQPLQLWQEVVGNEAPHLVA